MDIFGFHYPRAFPTWWGDDWITLVYSPGNMKVCGQGLLLLHAPPQCMPIYVAAGMLSPWRLAHPAACAAPRAHCQKLPDVKLDHKLEDIRYSVGEDKAKLGVLQREVDLHKATLQKYIQAHPAGRRLGR